MRAFEQAGRCFNDMAVEFTTTGKVPPSPAPVPGPVGGGGGGGSSGSSPRAAAAGPVVGKRIDPSEGFERAIACYQRASKLAVAKNDARSAGRLVGECGDIEERLAAPKILSVRKGPFESQQDYDAKRERMRQAMRGKSCLERNLAALKCYDEAERLHLQCRFEQQARVYVQKRALIYMKQLEYALAIATLEKIAAQDLESDLGKFTTPIIYCQCLLAHLAIYAVLMSDDQQMAADLAPAKVKIDRYDNPGAERNRERERLSELERKQLGASSSSSSSAAAAGGEEKPTSIRDARSENTLAMYVRFALRRSPSRSISQHPFLHSFRHSCILISQHPFLRSFRHACILPHSFVLFPALSSRSQSRAAAAEPDARLATAEQGPFARALPRARALALRGRRCSSRRSVIHSESRRLGRGRGLRRRRRGQQGEGGPAAVQPARL